MMRIFATILSIGCLKVNAVNYYVKNSGSDAASGLSDGTAWQTSAKINSFSFSSGDSVFFNRGDSWNERLIPPTANVYFGSYSSGDKPLITGFQTLSMNSLGGNLYSATATNAPKYLNTVMIDGEIRKKGRYPNTGWLTFNNAGSSQTQLVGTGLTGTPDYTGGEVVVRTNNFMIDVAVINSQSTSTLNLNAYRMNEPALTYAPGGNHFFIQNHPSVLDVNYEWSHDSATNLLTVYCDHVPVVKYSIFDTLVYTHLKDNIVFNGLEFQGGDKVTLYLDSSDNSKFINGAVKNSGTVGIEMRESHAAIIQNDSILNSLSGAIYIRGGGMDSSDFSNNYFKNTGIWAGMGMSGNAKYMAMTLWGGDNMRATNNKFDSTGFNVIYYAGKKQFIYQNEMDWFCFIKDDGAGVYTYIGGQPANLDSGTIIRKNIIRNGMGAAYGSFTASAASGIYFDLNTKWVTADSNTIYNTVHSGINFFSANNINIYDNTVVDSVGIPFRLWDETYLTVKRNIFYSTSGSVNTPCFYTAGATNANSVIDSNYYLINNNNATRFKRINSYFNLADWIVATGWDANSHEDPSSQTSKIGILYINPTTSDSTVTFSDWKVDAMGELYNSSAVIEPYGSKLLFPTDAPATPAATYHIGNLIFR